MSKRMRDDNAAQQPLRPRPPARRGAPEWLTPAGLGIVIALSGITWYDAHTFRTDVTERLAKIDRGMADLGTKVTAAAKQAPAPAKGPDPNKAYTIKTEGSPAKGRADAPVTIAEFSDFQ